MMSEAAPPPTLSGSYLSKKAIASAWEVFAKMRPLVISAMVASGALGLAGAFFRLDLGISSNSAFPQGTLFSLIQVLVGSAITVPLAVATHRLILKGEITPGIIALRKSYHWAFFAWLFGFAFIPVLLMDLPPLRGSGILEVVLGVVGLIVWINSALIFPAIAIEASNAGWLDRFTTSWRQMRGHVWLFIRALLLALIPLFVSLLFFLGVFIIVMLVLAGLSVPEQVWGPLVAGAFSVFQPASILIGAAVASWLYLYVKDGPSA